MRILNTKRDIRSERGVSLIIALLALVVISLLTAGLILVTQTEIWTTASYRELAQARYAAEAGVQNTINFLQYTYVAPTNYASYTMTSNPVTYNGNPVVLSAIPSVASNYPDATQQTAFSTALSTQALPGLGNASYSTSAKLLSMKPASGVSWLGAGGGGGAVQTWQITSQGSVNGVRSATVQVVATYTRTGSPLFNYPIEATSPACGSITFTSKGSLTDSYNSTNGPYSAANSSKTGGNLATNGNVNLGSGVTVDGTIFVPNTTAGPCPDGITSKGTYLGASKLSAPLNPPLPWGCTSQPCYPPGTLTTAAQNVSTSCGSVPGCTKNGTTALFDGGKATTANVFALAPGAYGNITINGADVVHVSAGTYNINSINFALDGQFVVDSGPVVFNLVGNCASGCPTESLPSGYSSTEVIYGAGYAGFNGVQRRGYGKPERLWRHHLWPVQSPLQRDTESTPDGLRGNQYRQARGHAQRHGDLRTQRRLLYARSSRRALRQRHHRKVRGCFRIALPLRRCPAKLGGAGRALPVDRIQLEQVLGRKLVSPDHSITPRSASDRGGCNALPIGVTTHYGKGGFPASGRGVVSSPDPCGLTFHRTGR
jgi:Tfp pilus assembly protein PilX